jgi:hypothetical protein
MKLGSEVASERKRSLCSYDKPAETNEGTASESTPPGLKKAKLEQNNAVAKAKQSATKKGKSGPEKKGAESNPPAPKKCVWKLLDRSLPENQVPPRIPPRDDWNPPLSEEEYAQLKLDLRDENHYLYKEHECKDGYQTWWQVVPNTFDFETVEKKCFYCHARLEGGRAKMARARRKEIEAGTGDFSDYGIY